MWPPHSASSLEDFLEHDEPQETHHIDFKREITDDRRHFAQHLASFATDGGWIVVGVDEPHPGTFEPAPLSLADQAERAENIAHTRIDPPLYIETTRLERDDGTSGYFLVRIPPLSPTLCTPSTTPTGVVGTSASSNSRTRRSIG